MRYLYKRGKGAKRRVMHLCVHDARTGEPIMMPLCCTRLIGFDTTSNVPLGGPVCKRCLSVLEAKETPDADRA